MPRLLKLNSFVSTGALVFFIVSMFKMGRIENEMATKHFGNYDMDQLRNLAGVKAAVQANMQNNYPMAQQQVPNQMPLQGSVQQLPPIGPPG